MSKLKKSSVAKSTYIRTFTDTIGTVKHIFDVYSATPVTSDRIATCSIFKMTDSNVYYIKWGTDKDAIFREKYLTSFNKLVKDSLEGYKKLGFKLRVYCDDTVFYMISDILTHPHIEIFNYTVPRLREEYGDHYGYYGTMIRFFPLFTDLENHRANITVVLDIDNKYPFQMINTCVKKRINFCYHTRNCYGLIFRMFKNDIDFPIIASLIYCDVNTMQLKRRLLDNFIDYCLIHNDIRYSQFLENSLVPKLKHKRLKYSYGIDEYFINIFVLNNIKARRIPYYLFIVLRDIHDAVDGYVHHLAKMQSDGKHLNTHLIKEYITKYANLFGFKFTKSDPVEMVTEFNAYLKNREITHKLLSHHDIKGFMDFMRHNYYKLGYPNKINMCLQNALTFKAKDKGIYKYFPETKKRIKMNF